MQNKSQIAHLFVDSQVLILLICFISSQWTQVNRRTGRRSVFQRTLRSRHGNIYTKDPTILIKNLEMGFTGQASVMPRSVTGHKVPNIYSKYQVFSSDPLSLKSDAFTNRVTSRNTSPKSQSDVYQEIPVLSERRRPTLDPSPYWIPMSHRGRF